MRFSRVINRIKERKQRALDGKYNCVPLPFPRFRTVFPGIERGRYIITTANQKVGKSKFCDYWFIYEPLFFMMEHPELKMKILYFTLEVNADAKYDEFLCHLLYRLDGIIYDTKALNSVDREFPCEERIQQLLESDRYKPYLEAYESMVTYIDDTKNPTGIYKICETYAEKHGHWTYKKGTKQDEYGDWVEGDIKDLYIQDDPEEYRVIILDNATNISLERGLTKKAEAIDKTSKYFIELRNKYGYIINLIQHQAQAQEGIENLKMNRTYPTSDGVGDCKTTTRDANSVIGLFNPAKYQIPTWEHYDITKFGDHIRFMLVIDERDYGAGGKVCPLLFNGASSVYTELPPPDNKAELEKVYQYIQKLEQPKVPRVQSKVMFAYSKTLNRFGSFSFLKYICRLFRSDKVEV